MATESIHTSDDVHVKAGCNEPTIVDEVVPFGDWGNMSTSQADNIPAKLAVDQA